MSFSTDLSLESISTNNSSTANLAAAATFTGTADRVDTFDAAHVSLFASQNCTVQVQQSSDGTNWDLVDSYTTTANVGFSVSVSCVSVFLRVLVTNNGASTTTSLRLSTQYSNDIQAGVRSPGQRTMANSMPVVLASDQTLLVKQEPNQQIIAGNAYTQVSLNVTTNAAETNILYLKNNSGTKTAYIFNYLAIPDPSNANTWVEFKLYYNPTVTANGTAATISNLLAGSANTSACNAFTGPTTSARGTLLKFWAAGLANAASAVQDMPFPNYFVLPPGQSLLLSCLAKANNQLVDTTFHWFEV